MPNKDSMTTKKVQKPDFVYMLYFKVKNQRIMTEKW